MNLILIKEKGVTFIKLLMLSIFYLTVNNAIAQSPIEEEDCFFSFLDSSCVEQKIPCSDTPPPLFILIFGELDPLHAHSITGEITSGRARRSHHSTVVLNDTEGDCIEPSQSDKVLINAFFRIKTPFKINQNTDYAMTVFRNNERMELNNNFSILNGTVFEKRTEIFVDDFMPICEDENDYNQFMAVVSTQLEIPLSKYPWWQFWRKYKYRNDVYKIIFEIADYNQEVIVRGLESYESEYEKQDSIHRHIEILPLPLCNIRRYGNQSEVNPYTEK